MNDTKMQIAMENIAGYKAEYVIEKARLFYRSDGAGYTDDMREAGRFTKAQAFAEQRATRGDCRALELTPPDFLTNRNAVNQVEKLLTDEEYLNFTALLHELVDESWRVGRHVSASSRMRCKAILLLKNKWEEQ